MITALLFVLAAAGGAVGRGLLTSRLNPLEGPPWGTLLVNISGSLALGLTSGLLPPTLTVIGVGGLGAYTTFSTVSVEVIRLTAGGRRGVAALYLTGSVIGCTAAAGFGLALAP